jgi:hypothetical protein
VTGRADGAAVRAGVAAYLAVLVPVVAVYTALHGTGAINGDAGVIVTALAAVVVAPALGGAVAVRRGTGSTPLTDSATACAVGALIYVVFRVLDAVVRGKGVTVSGLVLLVMLSALVGVGAGALSVRMRAG